MDAPVIEGFWTVAEVAQELRLTETAVRYWLRERPDLFEARYRRFGRSPRLRRIITTSEVARLSQLVLATCVSPPSRRICRVRTQAAS